MQGLYQSLPASWYSGRRNQRHRAAFREFGQRVRHRVRIMNGMTFSRMFFALVAPALAVALVALACSAASAASAAERVPVRIIAINDLHGHLEPGENSIAVPHPDDPTRAVALRAGAQSASASEGGRRCDPARRGCRRCPWRRLPPMIAAAIRPGVRYSRFAQARA